MQRGKIKDVVKDIVGLLLYVAIIFGLVFLVRNFLVQRVVVDGISMENTLEDGDNVFIDRLCHYTGNIDRYDVIVFKYAYDTDSYFVKRVIGLPGETVEIDRKGTIYIDGEALEEDYGKEKIADPGIAKNSVELSDDEYFVLGDNRNNSVDSRDATVAAVDLGRIRGKVFFRLWPFDSFGTIK